MVDMISEIMFTHVDSSHGKQSSWNNFNQHNNKSSFMHRCRSEPRLTDKQPSLDSLSDAFSTKSTVLKSYLYRKESIKSILMS